MSTGGGALAVADYPPEWDEVVERPDGKRRDHRAEYQRRKAKRYQRACDIRDRLRTEMGGMCRVCGSTENLEFHHPKGRTWNCRKQCLENRMRLYELDFKQGLLTLLCSFCNKKIGDPVNGFWQRSAAKRKGRR